MIGVVLWCDAEAGKAVFWCEDQGDLAYFEDPALPGIASEVFFDAGDMVQFDVTNESRQRRARNPRLLQEQGYATLPERLREDAAKPPVAACTATSAKIIPFQAAARAVRRRQNSLQQA
ncbi:hypothetical protein [Sulfitobacter aestuariivivens]|uniref:Uncharacterized protein n=1 Tax=Sulfitobacter aestuariivivens TaxID=2766981 RepID=A0A927HFB1_9RHOB|nr:hypothetical protein [Sulfitobacter aestuariivivens]MBD3663055.1 hypothetical protein [Sulfitobacter aestuariivivens]